MSNDVYINAVGAHLPGDVISNDEMMDYLGAINERSQSLGKFVLRQNKIKGRYYAKRRDGTFTSSNAKMAAIAARDAVSRSEVALADIDYLATSTTQGDLLVPGHASAVHGSLGTGALEIANFQSVCASSIMATQSAYLQVKANDKKAALVTGSEFSSRWFQPGFYECGLDNDNQMDAEFLRWTLSDGAGAILLEPRRNTHRPSLKIEWIDLISLADRFDVCMYAGVPRDDRFDLENVWSHHDGPVQAAQNGAIMLMQDFVLLKKMIKSWVGRYLDLVDDGRIEPDEVDTLLCHYSAHSLREEIVSLLEKTGAMIPEDKWFTNLATKGNTGSAALFVMLDELINQVGVHEGQRILCIVPESGRGVISFMMLTVV